MATAFLPKFDTLPPFWREFFQGPFRVGAIAPSSRHLAKMLVRNTAVATAEKIIELGPGDGIVTKEIMKQKKTEAVLLGIEKNPAFIVPLQNRFSTATFIHACAGTLRETAAAHDVIPADCILSTLPWALFSPALQSMIICSAKDCLREEGTFATAVCYGTHLLPSGRTLRRLLYEHFPSVRISPVLFANIPPAFIYYCSR